ncbi:MAG: antibiotic biosynthesis monooxygenase [Phycisphaerales bacterium]|nr:MAG: antibiotic biosynthesis monooxygenase [Phycisphaerales bacterium]
MTVNSRIHALADVQKDVEQALLEIVRLARAEQGCITFDLHRAVDDPTQFWISECWASQDALLQHLSKPYLKAWLERSTSLVAEPIEITQWKLIGSSR